jgi:putative hydrolase of the HAD superfamily
MSGREAGVRAVIFDSGGTLVHDKGFSRVLSEKISTALQVIAGLEVSPVRIEKLWECSEWQREDVELWDLARVMFLLRGLGLTPTVRLSELVYAAVLEAYLEGFELERSAPLVLRGLKEAGFKLGILTNVGSYELVKLRYEREGLLNLFDVVIASQAFPWRKPSRRIFEAACYLLGVKPAETVYVGDDAQLDIAGAKAAGLRAIQVLKYAREKSQLADAWIESIEELPAAIEKLMRPGSR